MIIDRFMSKYPYTDFHELNLDYILRMIVEQNKTIANFVSLNTIKYANPILWNIATQYEQNTVVVDENTGTAYISVKPVPSGVALSNTDFWTVIFTLDLVSANQNLSSHDASYNTLAEFESEVGDWLIWKGTLYNVIQPIALNTAYLPGFNIEEKKVEDFVKSYVTTLTDTTEMLSGSIMLMGGQIDSINGSVMRMGGQIDSINGSVMEMAGKVLDIETLTDQINSRINKTVLVDYDHYGITGVGDETAKFDALLDDLEDDTHYIFPKITVHVIFGSQIRHCTHNNIVIDGLCLDGTKNHVLYPDDPDASGVGIQFSGNNIRIVDCDLSNIYQCLLIGPGENYIIDRCKFYQCGYGVLQMRHTTSNNGIVSNCIFTHNSNDAVELNCDTAPSKNWLITNNICTGYDNFPSAAIEERFCGVTNVQNVIISNNIAYNINGDSIVHVENNAQDVTIANNDFGEFVGLAAVLILVNTMSERRRVIISGNNFHSSVSDGAYRKFIQANGTANDVTVTNNTFYSTLDENEMGLRSGTTNTFTVCDINMPNYKGSIVSCSHCRFRVKGQNDLGGGLFNNNVFETTLSPSIKRTTTPGQARPWDYSQFKNNTLNHAIQINDAFHSVIMDNFVTTDGETNNFSGININPETTSTIKDNLIGGK